VKRNRGYAVRSAEDECGILADTGEHWDADDAGDVEIAYAMAAPECRARVLRQYVSKAEFAAARRENQSFAEGLASAAGFSDREIRGLLHLQDGGAPGGGWKGDCFRWSLPTKEGTP
jgi:hypothetical protein